MSLWANFPEDTDGGSPHTLISDWPAGGATFNLRYNPEAGTIQVELIVNGTNNTISQTLSASNFTNWNYISFTYNGDLLTLYLNNNTPATTDASNGNIIAWRYILLDKNKTMTHIVRVI